MLFFAFYDQANKVLRLLQSFGSDLVTRLIYGELKKSRDELRYETNEMFRLADRVAFVLDDSDLLKEPKMFH